MTSPSKITGAPALPANKGQLTRRTQTEMYRRFLDPAVAAQRLRDDIATRSQIADEAVAQVDDATIARSATFDLAVEDLDTIQPLLVTPFCLMKALYRMTRR